MPKTIVNILVSLLCLIGISSAFAVSAKNTTPDYSKIRQYITQIVNNSIILQQQKSNINFPQTPFAPLHTLMRQGLQSQKDSALVTPINTQVTQPVRQPISTLPTKTIIKQTAPAKLNTGIGNVPEDNQQNDSDGIQFNF